MPRTLLIVWSSILVMSSAAMAADYRPDEFLNLDLSKAVLSPKPLGPANTFGPVAAAAQTDSDVAGPRAHARPAPRAAAGTVHKRRDAARHSTHQAGASSQSTGRPGHGYADRGLALQIRRHLHVEAIVTRPS
jgi:hypothetical protein